MMKKSNSINAALSLYPKDGEKREGTFASLNVSDDKKTAEMEIWDFIGDEWYGTTAKEFVAQLKDLPDTVENINVSISSPGGWVWDAIEIYQALKSHSAHVTTSVSAIAASAATIIYMAGDTRVVGPYADFMIHKPWACSCGDASKMRKVADRLDSDQEKLVDIYIENGCQKDREEVNDMLNEETWLRGEDLVDLGFATVLEDDLQAAACLFNVNEMPGCPEHHQRLANAWQKRKKESASRDDGMTRRKAKASVSQRDAVESTSDVWKRVLKAKLNKMEK